MRRLFPVLFLPLLAACEQWVIGPVDPIPPAPTNLTSVSLDGAIALSWDDNAHDWDPGLFQLYRVWSSGYDLDNDRCVGGWELEGTTVAPEFVVGALVNGSPRCFQVHAETVTGTSSDYSAIRFDTPRFDANGVAVFARQIDDSRAGFRFWRDLNGDDRANRQELAFVASGAATTIDLAVLRDEDGTFWFEPVRAGTRIRPWGDGPIASLTEIDFAPANGYTRSVLEAIAGWGYVIEMDGDDGWKRYGAIRVTSIAGGHVLLEWAFQDDPGNPELLVIR